MSVLGPLVKDEDGLHNIYKIGKINGVVYEYLCDNISRSPGKSAK